MCSETLRLQFTDDPQSIFMGETVKTDQIQFCKSGRLKAY